MNQRLIGAAIAVGNGTRYNPARAEIGQLDQFNLYSRGRFSAVGIQHMRGQAPVHLQPIVRGDELIDA
jgi:hypothetical protein